MTAHTPLRRHDRHHAEPVHELLQRAEGWAETTGLAPEGKPEEGLPWHALLLVALVLFLLVAFEITLTFEIAKLVTGRA